MIAHCMLNMHSCCVLPNHLVLHTQGLKTWEQSNFQNYFQITLPITAGKCKHKYLTTTTIVESLHSATPLGRWLNRSRLKEVSSFQGYPRISNRGVPLIQVAILLYIHVTIALLRVFLGKKKSQDLSSFKP